ncbi:MAG: flagellar export chaperone FliS [Pseudomonadota bacterium]|nr:flagellar export chaperone FliS [Pseudomonadota bacterium]
MFGSPKSGASAYANVGVETGVAAASPHKLIVMLYDGALVAVATAQQHMKAGNIAAKGKSISQAIAIIESGLRASLDKTVGGTIAASLDALYEYMGNRLIIANLKNQPEVLQEVHALLLDLKTTWEAIAPRVDVNLNAPPNRPAPDLSTYAPTLMKA